MLKIQPVSCLSRRKRGLKSRPGRQHSKGVIKNPPKFLRSKRTYGTVFMVQLRPARLNEPRLPPSSEPSCDKLALSLALLWADRLACKHAFRLRPAQLYPGGLGWLLMSGKDADESILARAAVSSRMHDRDLSGPCDEGDSERSRFSNAGHRPCGY